MSRFGNPQQPSKNGTNVVMIVGLVLLFAILIIGIWGTCTESGKSAFTNLKGKFSGSNNDLRSLDLVMFMNPNCPWCKKMIGVLTSEGQINNVQIVDITNPEGASIAKQFGAHKQPVPSFISKKLKIGTIGYRDSVSKLINDLKNQPSESKSSDEPVQPGGGGPIDINIVQGLQIVLFAREGCGFCTKAKESCNQAGITNVIQIVDITTPEGQQMASNMLPPGITGVPVWISLATKKHVVGYKPIENIISELQ